MAIAAVAGDRMSGTTETFARAKIDALLRDAGWDITDGASVLFESALPDGTMADYVLCDRPTVRRQGHLGVPDPDIVHLDPASRNTASSSRLTSHLRRMRLPAWMLFFLIFLV